MATRLPQTQKVVHMIIATVILGCLLFIHAPHAFASNFVNRVEQAEITTSDLAHYELGQIDDSLTSPKKRVLEVPILDYHDVRPIKSVDAFSKRHYIITPELFELQMRMLKQKGYHVIRLQDLATYLASSTPLSSKSVVITFDDGFQSQFEYAFPILKKYDFPATFFIFTDAIDKTPGYMTWSEVTALDKAGMDIGNHTTSHAHLRNVKRLDQLNKEIIASKLVLEQHTKNPVKSFAYPFGEYNNNIAAFVKSAGYTTAVSVRDGKFHTKEDVFTLKRYSMNNNNRVFAKLFLGSTEAAATSTTQRANRK